MSTLLDEVIAEHNPCEVFALFSGGHDSLATTHLTSQHPRFSGVIHINTGIGIPETNEFVRETCREHGWPLHELRPQTKYIQLIAQHGFPGAHVHNMIYRYLKERPLHHFTSRIRAKRKGRVMLCAGARSQESVVRMGTVTPVTVEGSRVWVNVIHDWPGEEVSRYVTERGLKRNPVKDRLCISGECLCGCFSSKYERHNIAVWYPHVDEHLSRLEDIVGRIADAGLSEEITSQARRWGWSAGAANDGRQMRLAMCWNCRPAESEEFVA